MARPRGRRNADYQASREALAIALRPLLMSPRGVRASFRELALAAGVSTATLRHYFGTREGTIAAVLGSLHQASLPYLADAATGQHGPVRESLRWLLTAVAGAWGRFGVGAAHGLGISAGLGDAVLGPAYVTELLEPTLQAAEARIARHVAQGELERCDLRYAALELMSPLLLGLLHQQNLLGVRCRPLNLGTFLEDHLKRFLRAHAGAPGKKPPPP